MMAYIHFTSHAPATFLIVPNDGDPADAGQTVLMNSDWDLWGVACSIGFEGSEKDKGAYGKALAWLKKHEGQQFADLDEYLPQLPIPEFAATQPARQLGKTAARKPLEVHFVWTTKAGKRKRESVAFDDAEAFMLKRWEAREETTAFMSAHEKLLGKISRTHGSKNLHYWWNPSNATGG